MGSRTRVVKIGQNVSGSWLNISTPLYIHSRFPIYLVLSILNSDDQSINDIIYNYKLDTVVEVL